MRHLAMQADMVDEYLQMSREVWEASKTMSRADRRQSIEDVYAVSDIHRREDAQDAPYTVDAMRVAHVPVVGILTPKVNPCAALFGSAETEYGFISDSVKQADMDPRVDMIALDIDSPGGYVDGVDETAMVIAATIKKTRSVVHNKAASAAYWLATQTDEIIAASPSTVVGSIGVAMEIVDYSEADKKAGVQYKTFTSTNAPKKRINPDSESGVSQITAGLDDLHDVFVSRVAAGRGVSPETVNANFGQGDTVIASKAQAAGMIDRVDGTIVSDDNLAVGEQSAAEASKTTPAEAGKMEELMNIQELMRDHPELFAELKTEFTQAGINEERSRVKDLRAWGEAAGDNAKIAELVDVAIADGSTAAQMNPQLMAAMVGGRQAGENPPTVKTEAVATEADSVEESMSRLRKAGAFSEVSHG